MKTLIRSLFIAGAFAGTAYAETPAPKKDPAPATDKAPAKAPAKQEVSAAEADKFLAFYNKFVDIAVASKEDCAKLTKESNALIDANGDLLKKIQEAKAANKELPQATKEKMMSRIKELMPAMKKCESDPAFTAVMQRMQGGKAPAASSTPPAKTTEPAKTEPAKTPPAKK